MNIRKAGEDSTAKAGKTSVQWANAQEAEISTKVLLAAAEMESKVPAYTEQPAAIRCIQCNIARMHAT